MADNLESILVIIALTFLGIFLSIRLIAYLISKNK